MKYDPRRVFEIILDELAQVLRLPPEAVDRCRRLMADLLRPRRPVLFLAAGERPPSNATVEAFRTLTALGIDASLIRSESFAGIWPEHELRARLGAVTLFDHPGGEDLVRLPERFPLLCVLTLSDNTVAKTALGLRDAIAPKVLRAFLDRGRPVVATGPPPQRIAMDEGAGMFWRLPLAMRQWVFEGYNILEQWGVEFVDAERLVEAIRRHVFGASVRVSPDKSSGAPGAERAARQFITRDDVHATLMRGERQLRVLSNTTVTDEARDFAARMGIVIVE